MFNANGRFSVGTGAQIDPATYKEKEHGAALWQNRRIQDDITIGDVVVPAAGCGPGPVRTMRHICVISAIHTIAGDGPPYVTAPPRIVVLSVNYSNMQAFKHAITGVPHTHD